MTNSKSKRALSLLCAFLMLAALSAFFCIDTTVAFAAETSGSWEYKTVSGGADIIAYHGTEADVVIPTKLNNGVKVVSVSGVRSSKKETLKTITFSSGIKKIGNGALKGYTKLEKVTFKGSTIQEIGMGAFDGCTSLKSITIPNSVKTIGSGAFAGCTSLTSAVLTGKVTEIPDRLFFGCSSLSVVTFPINASSIGDNAFTGCKKLKTVNFPTKLVSIGTSAFENCTSLSSPVLPSSNLLTIGEAAFRGCTAMTTIFIPNSVKTIKNSAFNGCSSLTAAYISPSLRSLGTDTFKACPKLKTIVFGGENGSFSNFIDLTAKPTVYYPSKYKTSWGRLSYNNTKSYTSYTATPSTKTVNLDVNKTKTVSVTVNPKNSPLGKAYSFVSSDPTVATVSATGTIQAKSAGKATITLTTVLGTKTNITVNIKPSAPTNVKATPNSVTSIKVSWSSVKGASGYKLYRSTSKSGTYSLVTTTTSTSYIDKGVKTGSTYYYKVLSYAGQGSSTLNSAYSAVVSRAATSPAPATVKAARTTSGTATITWSKSLGATGYEVYMATSKSGTYTKIASVKSSTLSYKKTGLTAGKTYYFKVCSYVTSGGKNVYSPYSTVKSVKV